MAGFVWLTGQHSFILTKTHPGCGFSIADQLQEQVSLTDIFNSYPRRKDETSCPRDLWFQNRLVSKGTNASSSDPLWNGCSVISRLSHRKDPEEQAQDLYKGYLSLSEQLGLGHPSQDQRPRSFYNLLVTPEWMAMVRRRREGAAGFSINALGFAGYLLATANSDLNWLKTHGPEALLREVILEIRGNTVVESSP